MEWTLHVFCDEAWWMLFEVAIDQQEKDTCIEELSIENTVCDGCKLLRVGVLTDPDDESDDDLLQDQVDSNDDKGDGSTNGLTHIFVKIILLTDWLFMLTSAIIINSEVLVVGVDGLISILGNFPSLHVVIVLVLEIGAISLHETSIMSLLILNNKSLVNIIVINGKSFPSFLVVRVLLIEGLIVNDWVLHFSLEALDGALEDEAAERHSRMMMMI